MSERRDTLERVLIDVLMHGRASAALARPSQAGKPAAVCVLLHTEREVFAFVGLPFLPPEERK